MSDKDALRWKGKTLITKWTGKTVDPNESYVTNNGMIILAYTDDGVTRIRNLGWDLPTVRKYRQHLKRLEAMMEDDWPDDPA